jgi:aminopeptidase N
MLIPINIGLLDKDGKDITGTNRTLHLTQEKQVFTFDHIKERPVPSILRDFSAPVIVHADISAQDLSFLIRHDSNDFNRWDAMQKLAQLELKQLIATAKNNQTLQTTAFIQEAFSALLQNADKDDDFTALTMVLPPEVELGQAMLQQKQKIDIDAIHTAREFLRRSLAHNNRAMLLDIISKRSGHDPLSINGASMAARSLKNTCLGYLGTLADSEIDTLAFNQFEKSLGKNMTDTVAALGVLTHRDTNYRSKAFAAFYDKWHNNKLVLDKWFALQAMADRPDILLQVKQLMQHPAFVITNPNMIYAVVRGFVSNLVHFHKIDGSGYRFLADVVLQLDGFNSQIAGRIVPPLVRMNDYDATRAMLMHDAVLLILNKTDLSKNVREVAEAGILATKAT